MPRRADPLLGDSEAGPLRRGTPAWRAEIRDCVDECERDPAYEGRVIEPLAGIFYPQVKADMNTERRRRERKAQR